MDALFVIVAELLLLPLLLWILILVELVLGTLGTAVGIVMGRRRPSDLVRHQWLRLRRRLVWSLLLASVALVLVDLVFFEALVNVVLGSIDDREDLDVRHAHAEGSFILGRIEIDHLEISGARGDLADPSARFELDIEKLIIDIDTGALLTATFAVEELSLDGVRGSYDRLRRAAPEREREQPGPAREFRLDRLHVGELALAVRDHGGAQVRELELELDELDIGPLRSDHAAFDALYRSRGRGSIAGIEFEMASHEVDGAPQMTLEIHDMPLAELGAPIERAAGVRAGGSADLVMVDRYHAEASPPELEIDVTLTLREFELHAGERATLATKMMLELAGDALGVLGREFPVAFELRIGEDELAGSRNLSESGIGERISDAIASALRDELQRAARRAKD
ncbi:hypothetical protein ACNOYE_05435 [Nannocystaceae bacterium ST9]